MTAFSTFIDALRLAGDDGDLSRQIHCRWTVMSANGQPVRASCGVEVMPLSGLLPPDTLDYIVVCGGLLHRGPQLDDAAMAYLAQAARHGTPLVGICTGSFVLARAGLLKDRRACVSWYHHRDLIDEFADVEPVSDRMYLIDRDRITCSGGTGAADLAAALIARHLGPAEANKCLQVLLIDRRREGDAAQPAPPLIPGDLDERVRRAMLLMEQNVSAPLSLPAIARFVGVSERQLDRLFRAALAKPPATLYRRLRLGHGRWLLANTRRPIADIAAATGFSDGAHFSRLFRREYDVAPAVYRSRSVGPLTHAGADAPADRRVF